MVNKILFSYHILILIIIGLFNLSGIDKPRKISFYKTINLIIFKYNTKSYMISKDFKLVILSVSSTLIFIHKIFPTFWNFSFASFIYTLPSPIPYLPNFTSILFPALSGGNLHLPIKDLPT